LPKLPIGGLGAAPGAGAALAGRGGNADVALGAPEVVDKVPDKVPDEALTGALAGGFSAAGSAGAAARGATDSAVRLHWRATARERAKRPSAARCQN
jgi:hypothetical protein